MSSPLLSVIIPVYNAGHFLREALESVLIQSYRPMEVIVIDDGSTDDSAEIFRSFKEIRYIYQENAGPASARNRGVAVANGEYIGFHDADDVCLPTRFAEQMDILLNNPNLELAFSRIQNFVEPGVVVPTYLQTPELMKPRMGFVSSAVVYRDVFDKVGLFNEELTIGEDFEWIVRAGERKICSCSLTDVLVMRRLHDLNLSNDITLGHKNLAQILMASIQRR